MRATYCLLKVGEGMQLAIYSRCMVQISAYNSIMMESFKNGHLVARVFVFESHEFIIILD